MEEVFFGGIHEKLRMVSITDSTMMRIVNAAMNKAHERVKSKEGAVERLNEISKFYELAVMQLEGCMKFVQDETSHEEEVLAGLSQIRDQLRGRLCESERAISDKDRELTERAESEARLRLEMEAKEAELAALRARLEGRDGEFCELKNSVDHQVWKIRQRLEPDYRDDRCRSDDDEAIGSDIDALKETLDVAFEEMIKNHEYLAGGKNRSVRLCSERENDASSSSLSEDFFWNRISWLEQENRDAGLEALISEEIYGVLLEGICRDVQVESRIGEEISMLVSSAVLRDFETSYNSNQMKLEALVYREARENRECKEASVLEQEKFQSLALETANNDEGERSFERVGAEESLVRNAGLLEESGDSESNENHTRLHFGVLHCDTHEVRNVSSSSTSSLSSVLAYPLVDCERETAAVLRFDSMLASMRGLFQVMVDFEQMVGEKLELHSLRLDEIYKRNLSQLAQVASSMREQKSLYRKAFIIRCQNLHKAEVEVDLLGDQVEILQSLLYKVYSSLQKYSLISQQSVWASDMLQIIKTELNEHETFISSAI